MLAFSSLRMYSSAATLRPGAASLRTLSSALGSRLQLATPQQHGRPGRAPWGAGLTVRAFKDQPQPPTGAARDAASGGGDGPSASELARRRQPIAPSIASAPVTVNRPVPAGLEEALVNPGQPRANMSCDREHPEGVEAVEHGAAGRYHLVHHPSNLTVLQQHVAFWDRDADGIIWPRDTYIGFRRLGFSVFISALAVPIIHLAFSLATQRTWLFDPRLPLRMDRMHKAKHGSDSESFDTEGRFVPQKFEEMFSKYDKEGKGALSWEEIVAMTEGNRNCGDFFGWTAEKLEWYVTFLLVARDMAGQRVLAKEDARGILDGTLFHRIAAELEAGKLGRKGAFVTGFTRRDNK